MNSLNMNTLNMNISDGLKCATYFLFQFILPLLYIYKKMKNRNAIWLAIINKQCRIMHT